jgi:iron complex outermembrane receptor protein
MEVTSVSRKQQKLSDTAAAIFVITQQDIRNSTATSVPELLRTVPGLDVSQINGSTWAISVHGFAEQYTGEMLVLIDGRIAFDPLVSGVVWADQPIVLQDIDRIEVIRGPGATLWGANAFNGVINIITKPAQETQGVMVSTGMGDDERGYDLVQYGGKLGKSTYYRAHAQYFDDGPAGTFNGLSSHDSWRDSSGGFRLDTRISNRDSVMMEGQAFRGQGGKEVTLPIFIPPFLQTIPSFTGHGGENAMARWTHKSDDGSETTLQASFGHILHPEALLDVNGDVISTSVQHERPIGDRHDVVFGADLIYRSATTLNHSGNTFFSPANPHFNIAGGFAQDEIVFANGAVRLTAGLRLEHNSLSGFDLQPNARALWKFSRTQSVWTAYSLAGRSPAPSDTAINTDLTAFPGPGGVQVLRLTGNPNLGAEKLNAFEAGYRIQPNKTLSLDATSFFNRYYSLIGNAPGQPFFEAGPPPRLVIPLVVQNNISGNSFGAELTGHWAPTAMLRFTTAYSYNGFAMFQKTEAGTSEVQLWGEAPRHKFNVGSSVGLTHGWTFDSKATFMDRRTAQNLPGYTLIDGALLWRPSESGEFRIGVNNIFDKEHVEFLSRQGTDSTTLGRSIYGRMVWHLGTQKIKTQ